MRGRTALLVIDVQRGMVEECGAEAWAGVLPNIGTLIRQARAAAVPVIYIQHDGPPEDSLAVGTPGWEIHPAIAPAPDETVIRKRTPDSFHDTPLSDELGARGIMHLIVAGAQTDLCVNATVRRAASEGYRVILAADAHTTASNDTLSHAQIVAHHNAALATIPPEGCITVQPTAAISFATDVTEA